MSFTHFRQGFTNGHKDSTDGKSNNPNRNIQVIQAVVNTSYTNNYISGYGQGYDSASREKLRKEISSKKELSR